MNPGATFERVYRALKQDLGSGRFSSGEHLEPANLSDELDSSITPVRDALHRLVGEGLVEAPRGDGFRTPLVTEMGLRHLYRWNATLLDLAARTPLAHEDPVLGADAPDSLARTESLFLAVARLPGNPEHVAAVARLSERLRPMRRVEADLLPEAVEIDALSAFLCEGAIGPLRRAIAVFHRKRERLAAEIVERLHQLR